MTSGAKPEGYSTVSPYLVVDDAERAIDFMRRVFGAVDLGRTAGKDGRIARAELRIGDTIVMVADSTDRWAAMPAHVHVYVDSVDATYEAGVEAGAFSVLPPSQKDGGERRCGFRDASGTTWWVATPNPR